MSYFNSLAEDVKSSLSHGVVIGIILIFWTLVSQLVGYGVLTANLSTSLASSIVSALYAVGIANVAMYVLLKAVEKYRE